jgi:FkbM family methyltransferase
MTDLIWAPPRAVVTQEWLQTELRSEMTDLVYREERRLFDKLAGGSNDGLLLFGAGNLGRRTLVGLRRIGVEPLAFVDNSGSLQDTLVEGLRVLSPEDAARDSPRAVVVVAIWTPYGPLAYPSIAAQMSALGCSRTVPFVPLFWKHQEEFLPTFCLDAPHRTYAEAEGVKAGYGLLADDRSRTEFLTQLSYLLSSMDSAEVKIPPNSESYFPRELLELSAHEVFVDCGAYDGDTIASFLEVSGGRFDAIVAFEPDPLAAIRLQQLVQGLVTRVRDRIQIEHKAVGAVEGPVSFEGAGTPESRISEAGALTVESTTIDAALRDLAPTFIKMDIEGAEEDALLGAAESIRAHRPVLAICIYHRQAHLYRLPSLIGRLSPDYSFFLRRRGPDGDLVCFAIPNERRRR